MVTQELLDLESKVLADIEKRKEEATTTAANFIKTEEKRKAFLNRANYSMSITHEYIEKTKAFIETMKQVPFDDDSPPPTAPSREKEPTIRSIQFHHGKEAARAASIARARSKYDF